MPSSPPGATRRRALVACSVAMTLLGCAGSDAPPSVVPEVAMAAPVPAVTPVAEAPADAGTRALHADHAPASEPAPEAPSPAPLRPVVPHTGTVQPSPDDPLHGRFTLADATRGLPPGGTLVAHIETSLGTLECKLFDQQAPLTVASFVGLARGTRPWKTPQGRWQKKPAYDGTTFHRVIQGFMIQGGDAKKNGTGEAGFHVPDEIWDGARHDRAGLLCMANRGPDTNSAQFFITDAAAPHLDGGYTIFGECGPEDRVHQIAAVPVSGERPVQPLVITKVTVTRR